MERLQVKLSEAERVELLRVISQGNAPAKAIRRAYILLGVDSACEASLHMSDEEASRVYHVNVRTVYVTKREYVQSGIVGATSRKEGTGKVRHSISDEAEKSICALSLEIPPNGREHWSLRLLAKEAVERGIVPKITHKAIADMLMRTTHAHGYKPK